MKCNSYSYLAAFTDRSTIDVHVRWVFFTFTEDTPKGAACVLILAYRSNTAVLVLYHYSALDIFSRLFNASQNLVGICRIELLRFTHIASDPLGGPWGRICVVEWGRVGCFSNEFIFFWVVIPVSARGNLPLCIGCCS